MINIVTVKNKNLEKEFVQFPFKLYKNCEYWVPPIISEEFIVLLFTVSVNCVY